MLKMTCGDPWFFAELLQRKDTRGAMRSYMILYSDCCMSRSVTVVILVIAISSYNSDVLLVAGGRTGNQPRLHC